MSSVRILLPSAVILAVASLLPAAEPARPTKEDIARWRSRIISRARCMAVSRPCPRHGPIDLDQGRAGLGVHVPGGAGGRIAQFAPQFTDLGHGMRKQPGHLRFQGARIHDLAQGGVGRQREQVARRSGEEPASSDRCDACIAGRGPWTAGEGPVRQDRLAAS